MYHQIKPIPSSLNGLDPGAHNLSGLSVNGAVKCSRNQTDVKPRDLDESLPIPKLRYDCEHRLEKNLSVFDQYDSK